MQHKQPRSVWFFLGLLFLIYGVIIFASGIYDLIKTHSVMTTIDHYHAAVWWGLVLFVAGVGFSRVAKFVRKQRLLLVQTA